MEKEHLYQTIAEKIRNEILDGTLKPGQKLPSVRKLTESWNCTPGTIQRAYRLLAEQGLVISRAGQGTHVQGKPDVQQLKSIRRANLVNKAEAFLLEALNLGYTQSEIEQSIRLAFDHWHIIQQEPVPTIKNHLRFAGSNDLAITWIASHFDQIVSGYQLSIQFGGSLSGLIALAENRADLAGIHLWDEKSQEYNSAYIQKILPGEKTGLVTLAQRSLGLILSPTLSKTIQGIEDLMQPQVRFINRQSGSGTRVWLESQLRKKHLTPEKINGYSTEKATHHDLARSIAEGEGNVGLGLAAAAHIYNLEYIPLISERYELAFKVSTYQNTSLKTLVHWLSGDQAKQALINLQGYDTSHSGEIRWIE